MSADDKISYIAVGYSISINCSMFKIASAAVHNCPYFTNVEIEVHVQSDYLKFALLNMYIY